MDCQRKSKPATESPLAWFGPENVTIVPETRVDWMATWFDWSVTVQT